MWSTQGQKDMVHIFLTSSPTGPLDGSRRVDGIDKWNGFGTGCMRCGRQIHAA